MTHGRVKARTGALQRDSWVRGMAGNCRSQSIAGLFSPTTLIRYMFSSSSVIALLNLLREHIQGLLDFWRSFAWVAENYREIRDAMFGWAYHFLPDPGFSASQRDGVILLLLTSGVVASTHLKQYTLMSRTFGGIPLAMGRWALVYAWCLIALFTLFWLALFFDTDWYPAIRIAIALLGGLVTLCVSVLFLYLGAKFCASAGVRELLPERYGPTSWLLGQLTGVHLFVCALWFDSIGLWRELTRGRQNNPKRDMATRSPLMVLLNVALSFVVGVVTLYWTWVAAAIATVGYPLYIYAHNQECGIELAFFVGALGAVCGGILFARRFVRWLYVKTWSEVFLRSRWTIGRFGNTTRNARIISLALKSVGLVIADMAVTFVIIFLTSELAITLLGLGNRL